MTTGCQETLQKLRALLRVYDFVGADRLCDELVDQVKASGMGCGKDSVKILQELRGERRFEAMERVGDALLDAGENDVGVRTEYVQALIDQGKLRGAENELRAIEKDYAGSPPDKVLGLLGRIYKQRYVEMKENDAPRASALLEQSMRHYLAASKRNPQELWHGINVVAIVARAQRDRVVLAGAPDVHALAGEILEQVEKRERANLPKWELGTGMEACLALGKGEEAFDWACDYVARQDVGAFELTSTYRQMKEVWQLDDATQPGSLLLPVLRHAITIRRGSISLAPGELRAGLNPATSVSFERCFRDDAPKQLSWYRRMMDAARGVARVAAEVEPDKGIGTGFLVSAKEILPGQADRFRPGELLLMTNSHVVSATQADTLRPHVAVASFEALEKAQRLVRLGDIVWESPRDVLDATLVRLKDPITADPALSYELAPEHDPPIFPEGCRRRMFVIGHPESGPLCVSLLDSLQVGWVDPMVHYRTPTLKGNSGSPVFDEYWQVLALHHGSRMTTEANEGIWIHAIRQAARAAKR